MSERWRSAAQGIKYWQYLLAAIATAVAAYTLLATAELDRVVREIHRANTGLFALALLSYYATVPIRAWRWSRLLDAVDGSVPFRDVVLFTMLALFFNTVLPAKLGDLHKTSQVSARNDAAWSSVLGTVTGTRSADIVTLGIGLFTTGLIVAGSLAGSVGTVLKIAAALVASLCLVLLVIAKTPRSVVPTRLRGYLEEFTSGLAVTVTFGQIGPMFGLTLVIWSANVVRTWFIFAALGIDVPIMYILFIAFLIAFLTGLPYTPAGIGVVEVVGTATLIGLDFSGPASVSVIVLDRAITLVSVVLVGLLVYLSYSYTAGTGRES